MTSPPGIHLCVWSLLHGARVGLCDQENTVGMMVYHSAVRLRKTQRIGGSQSPCHERPYGEGHVERAILDVETRASSDDCSPSRHLNISTTTS